MSLLLSSRAGRWHGFPRVSGDEPIVMNLNPVGAMFSPREWG